MGYIGQVPTAIPLTSADITDGTIALADMAVNSIDSDQYVDGSIDNAHIADDAIDSEHYAAGSIDLEHMSSQSVDEDNLHISNAGSNGQFLSKQSGDAGGLTWAEAGGGKVLQHGTRFVNSGTHSITATSATAVAYSGTAFEASIVPTAATSRLMVIAEFHAYKANNVSGNGVFVNCYRRINSGSPSNIATICTYQGYYSTMQVWNMKINWNNCFVGGNANEWSSGWSSGDTVTYSIYAYGSGGSSSIQIGQSLSRMVIIEYGA